MKVNLKSDIFPIYSITALWHQKNITESSSVKDLPEGRCWNSTSFSTMFKEELSETKQQIYIIDWWKKYKRKKENRSKGLSIPILSINFKKFDTWVLSWFSHWTFDIGQTDQEVLISFDDYNRIKNLIARAGI